MKFNQAFTMAEALIVLSVVGVLAALSVVAVNNSKPDENIIMFRRGYATTAKAVQNLLNDTTLYPNANSTVTASKLGSSADNKKGLTDTSGENGNNFAYNFALLINPITALTGTNCNDTGNTLSTKTCKFTTADGIYWEVNSDMTSANPYATVLMKLYGEQGGSCTYDPTSCPKPTAFELRIDKLGNIKPVYKRNGRYKFDPVAATYLYYSKINKHSKIPRDARWFT